MKPAAKFALQFMLLGVLVFAGTIVGSAMGWLKYCPDPLMLPDGGMKQIFRADDAGEEDLIDDGGVHDVTPWLESESLDAGTRESVPLPKPPSSDAGVVVHPKAMEAPRAVRDAGTAGDGGASKELAPKWDAGVLEQDSDAHVRGDVGDFPVQP